MAFNFWRYSSFCPPGCRAAQWPWSHRGWEGIFPIIKQAVYFNIQLKGALHAHARANAHVHACTGGKGLKATLLCKPLVMCFPNGSNCIVWEHGCFVPSALHWWIAVSRPFFKDILLSIVKKARDCCPWVVLVLFKHQRRGGQWQRKCLQQANKH